MSTYPEALTEHLAGNQDVGLGNDIREDARQRQVGAEGHDPARASK